MNIDSLNIDTLHKYVPNVLSVAEGEPALFDKLQPYIESAKLMLEKDYLGSDDFLSEQHNELAIKIVVTEALANAVPSLDIIITPTGFGVVNTDNLAPASKERVERLIQSLRSFAKANTALLVDICRNYDEWRNSERGSWFCATFLSSLNDFQGSMFNDFTYAELRAITIAVEGELRDRYLGSALMQRLRDDYNSGNERMLSDVVRTGILELVKEKLGAKYTPQSMWRVARRIIAQLEYYPTYKDLLLSATELISPEPFKNDVKGGYYF